MRDYKKNPLKYGEQITKEELSYYYIKKNLTQEECAKIFCCSIPKIYKAIKIHNLIKPKELIDKQKEKTNLRKYGCKNPAQNKKVQNKMRATCLEKYGVENVSYRQETLEKRNKVWEEKYGMNPLLLKENKEKVKQSNIQKYGVDNVFKRKDVIKEAVQNKYGVDNYFQTEEFKEKSKKTCLEKYGVEYSCQSPIVQQKVINTNMERYGVPWNQQCKQISDKVKNTLLSRYGVDNPSHLPDYQEKCDNTKTLHGTHNTSKTEEDIYILLRQKFSLVKRNYKTKLYPYKCDFYIPGKDLYIEYQGTWGHGKEPFDPNNKKHLTIVEEWKKKSKEINYKGKTKDSYKNSIKTWTIRDPLKRQTAKKNNLNWIEFFNFKEFLDWFNFQ